MANKNFKVKNNVQIPDITSASFLTTDSNGVVTSGSTLAISAGGTGQTTATNAINALLPLQTSNDNKFLQTSGINTQWTKVYNQVIKNAGTTVNPRGTVNFVGATFEDDSVNDITTITLGGGAATPTTIGSVYGLTDGNNSGTVALGYSSLSSLAGGSNNIVVGNYALDTISTSFANVAIGNSSLRDIIGNGNTAVGASSATSALTGNNNTFLGRSSGTTFSSGSNNTIIGYNSTPSSSTVDNEITIGNSSVTRFRIPGIGLDWTSAPSTDNITTYSLMGVY